MSEENSNNTEDTRLPQGEIVFYRTPLAELPLMLLILVLCVLSVALSVRYPASVQRLYLGQVGNLYLEFPIPLFALIPINVIGILVHRLFDARYTIGVDYVRAVEGLLGFQKKDVRLELPDIRGVEIDRGVYGRILNIGDMYVGTAMKELAEMHLRKVYNPSNLRDIILERRRAFQIAKVTAAESVD